MKNLLLKILIKALIGNQLESIPLRKLFMNVYDIEVGMYSYGCFCPVRIAPGSRIGRYCSIADTVRILNGNHGLEYLTLHAYTYNPSLGVVDRETIKRTQCRVGDDAWIGHNAIILPRVSFIGRGAVVAAGAVVTKNVPAYSIVGGNPAKVIKMRFDDEIIKSIEGSKWWLWDKAELMQRIKETPDLIYKPSAYFSMQDKPNNMIKVDKGPIWSR